PDRRPARGGRPRPLPRVAGELPGGRGAGGAGAGGGDPGRAGFLSPRPSPHPRPLSRPPAHPPSPGEGRKAGAPFRQRRVGAPSSPGEGGGRGDGRRGSG